MSIGKDKKIIQVILHKDTKSFVDTYCSIFHVSVSEFCNDAICTKVISLMNNDLLKKRSLSEEVHID